MINKHTVILLALICMPVSAIEAAHQEADKNLLSVERRSLTAWVVGDHPSTPTRILVCRAYSLCQPESHPQVQGCGIEEVIRIHGGSGPFAVAGYRMGLRALKELRLTKGSFTIQVVHESPQEVQWSCIADGLQAATGASLGKLNLRMRAVAQPRLVRSIVINRETGVQLIFKLQDTFSKRFLNLPEEKLTEAGELVMQLKDEEIFTIQHSQ